MSEIAIKVNNVGKKYNIGRIKTNDLRESFRSFMRNLDFFKKKQSDFWALQNIDFEINRGDTVAVIGRNGAGKSTLLKILSRITKPTTGRLEIYGLVSSLLEVGTGFHMELTGRENVFLNGTILGMRRAEIRSKFDEIVEFSGVENFIDTPVKHYSSGMKVRLAFSVAAHLEPEILIIDEVLAVGDAEFQKKCLGKMEDVAKEGRTVVFVSHNMTAVKNLCKRGIVLQKGKIIENNSIEKAIETYISSYSVHSQKHVNLSGLTRKYNGPVFFNSVTFKDIIIPFGEKIVFDVNINTIQSHYESKNIDLAIAIRNNVGVNFVHCSNRFLHKEFAFKSPEKNFRFEIENYLKPGQYYLTLFLRIDGIINDWLTDIVCFEIQDGSPYPFNNLSEIQGLVYPEFDVIEIK